MFRLTGIIKYRGNYHVSDVLNLYILYFLICLSNLNDRATRPRYMLNGTYLSSCLSFKNYNN